MYKCNKKRVVNNLQNIIMVINIMKEDMADLIKIKEEQQVYLLNKNRLLNC